MKGARKLVTLALVAASTAAAGGARAAESRTYDVFVPSTRYQQCIQIALYASGNACAVPSDSTLERELLATEDGAFLNRVRGVGGNAATATKARGTASQTLTVVLDEPVPAIDLSFSYRIDSLTVSGTGFCGAVMSASGGCLYAQGSATMNVTAPSGGHLCADGSDATAGYPFGYTYFGNAVKGANTPGDYSGGFYLRCHFSDVAAGATVTFTFATNTQVSPSGNEETAVVAGRLNAVTLSG